MDTWDWVLSLLATVGIIVATVHGPRVLKFYVQNWIKSQSDKELERVRSQFAMDLEQAKSELSIHANKHLTWHDKEHEVFPEIWARLCDARNSLGANVNPLTDDYDLDRMSVGQFAKWLKIINFTEDEKEMMQKAEQRNSLYREIRDRYKDLEARKKQHELMSYMQKNRIFLSPDIKIKIDKIERQLQKSLDEKDQAREGHPEDVPFHRKAWTTFTDDILPLMEEIETVLQEKLHPDLTSKNRDH